MKKKGNTHKLLHLFMVLSVVFGFVFYIFYYSNSTGFTIFQDKNQSDFNGGTYLNTEFTGNYIGLISGQTSGKYTSRVYDAGSSAAWKTFSWISEKPQENRIIIVDKSSDVWKSVNGGVTWSLAKDDYNGIEGDNVDSMTKDYSNNLYILTKTSVWKSTDYGTSWTKTSDDYNANDSQNPKFQFEKRKKKCLPI